MNFRICILAVIVICIACGGKKGDQADYRDLTDRRQLDSALTLVTEALEKDPADRDALFYQGKTRFLKKDPAKARESFEKAISGADNVPYQHYLYLARVYDDLGEYDKAAKVFLKCYKANSGLASFSGTDTLGFAVKARYYLDQNHKRLSFLAARTLDHAIKLQPNRTDWKILYAEALLQGSYERGIRDPKMLKFFENNLKRLEKKHSQEPALMVLKGLYLNNKKESTEQYKNALEKDPGNLRARFLIAEWMLKYHDPDGALVQFREILAKDPNHIQALLGTGWVALKKQEFVKAEGIFRKVLDLDSENAIAWYNLGVAMEPQRKKHRPFATIAAYEKCIALNPYLADAFYNLGRMYYLCYKYPLAEHILDRAIHLDPRHYNAYVILSNVYIKTRRPDKARAILKTVLQFDPDNKAAKANLMKIPSE